MAAVANPRLPTRRVLGPLHLVRPDAAAVERAVRQVCNAPFDYPHVGATRAELPEGWHHDEHSAELGAGEACWTRARAALTGWRQFDLDWVWPHDTSVPLEPGRAFAFTSRQLGVWSVNVCRVAFVVDEEDEHGRRFGFGYGTVGSHVLRGEELFLLEQDRAGVVRFTIRKFARPAHPLVALVLPLARTAQRRFSLDALERIEAEVRGCR